MDSFDAVANSLLPRVDQGDTARLEITDIARDDRESVHQGSGADQCIAFTGLIGHMQAGATVFLARDLAAPFEARQFPVFSFFKHWQKWTGAVG